MSYIDTSTIVAALDPEDPRYHRTRKILEEEEYKVISELALAELANVISRREELVANIASKLGLTRELAVITIILYITRKFKLNYGSTREFSKTPPLGETYAPIAEAIKLSSKLKLKTLNTLHIAYVKILKNKGQPIRKIITVDKNFKKSKNQIENIAKTRLHIIE